MKKDKYKIKVNRCPIQVEQVDEIICEDPETGEMTKPLGTYTPASSTILVLKELEPEFKRRVILHELIHNFLVPFSLDLQEHAIDILTHGLINLFEDNKSFCKELFKI